MEAIIIFILFVFVIIVLNATSKRNYDMEMLKLWYGRPRHYNIIDKINEQQKAVWAEIVWIQLTAKLEERELTKEEQREIEEKWKSVETWLLLRKELERK